jgi:hypothetical protein
MLHTWLGPIHGVHGEREGHHESKNKRERMCETRIDMMRMKRVRTETCMTRTMKGIKVKEKKKRS